MKNPFFINRNLAGKRMVVIQGLINIFDGLVSIITFGTISTNLQLTYARRMAKAYIIRQKEKTK